MFRRILLLVFIFANLTVQANVAFACSMMGGALVTAEHCCCKTRHGATEHDPEGHQGCCKTVATISVGPSHDIAGLAAEIKAPLPEWQIVPPLPGASLAEAAVSLELSHSPPIEPVVLNRYGSDLYLQTLRLRL